MILKPKIKTGTCIEASISMSPLRAVKVCQLQIWYEFHHTSLQCSKKNFKCTNSASPGLKVFYSHAGFHNKQISTSDKRVSHVVS